MTPRTIAVLDFEATCEKRDTESAFDTTRQEVIEFPVMLIDSLEARVVDTFHAYVRPTFQPTLTPFCTSLTSITQATVDASKPIEEVMVDFTAWCVARGLSTETTVVATCGDWDMRQMWPKQVALKPGLVTPPIFKAWCNLKVIFQRQEGEKAAGMMGMLSHAGIAHTGVHHSGIDDVKNLCNLTLWMLSKGSAVVPTWAEAERQAERAHYDKKVRGRQQLLRDHQVALSRLPEAVSPEVRQAYEEKIARAEAELAAFVAKRGVFSSVPG